MKDKLKNLKTKKTVLITVVFLVLFFSCVFISYNLSNPTKLNSLLARVVQGEEPANSAFKDIDLYKVVIDAYNTKNGDSKPYTYNLTDSELASITSLSANKKNIEDASGIEKLTGLTYLNLNNNDIGSIDLSNNTELTKLYLDQNELSSIDLSNNTKLTAYNLKGNNFYNFKNLKVGDNIKIDEIIKNPDGIISKLVILPDSVAKIEDGYLKALEEGNFRFIFTDVYPQTNSYPSRILTVHGKLLSNKYTIYEDDKYIYVGSDNDNTILDDLSKSLAGISIEENDLIIKDKDGNEIDRYKLIRVSSDKYDLDKDVIETDEFDINDITIENATITYENGKLIISNKDKVIKEITVKTKAKEKEQIEVITTTKSDKENSESSNHGIENENNDNKLTSTNNKTNSNPSTLDNMYSYIIILIIGIFVLLYFLGIQKRKINN